MYGNSFFAAFAAFVQVSVVFDFGLLLVFKNNRSIFKSIFDHVRKGIPFSWVMGFATEQVGRVKKPRTVPESVNQLRADVSNKKNDLMSPANYEYMCDYMAVTGVVSGLYAMLWLVLVPWSYSHVEQSESLYLTLSACTVVAELIMVANIFARERRKRKNEEKGQEGKKKAKVLQMTRAAMVLHSAGIYTISCAIGLLLLYLNLTVEATLPFHQLFLFSLAIAYGPVCFYVLHVASAFVYRLFKSFSLFKETIQLRHVINKMPQGK